jgi:hypothetical protein
MQHLEVSGVVQPIKGLLGVKGLICLLAQNQCVKELLSHKYILLTECDSGTIQKLAISS